jgi:DNA-binding NtrC family response regulator
VAERILIVDDERLTRETLVERLRDEGFEADAFANAYEALEALEAGQVDVVLTDLRMPSMDGVEFHRRIRERWPEVGVLFMTAFGTVASAVEAMREGAEDYLTKPLNTEELIIRVRRVIHHQRDREEIRRLRVESTHRRNFGDLLYRSAVMEVAVGRALAVADTDVTVLVHGATGTGKEVLSRALHQHSHRATGPFVAVNCAGLNPNLVESELFGHEAGAFTGASRLRKGRLEIAEGGTLFVDEVDDLSLENQIRLLRFLQDHTFERVGSSRTLQADVRVVCATKRNLEELVAAGAFREDLFYRVNTVVIELPALKDRREDVLPLAEFFLRTARGGTGTAGPPPLSPATVRSLLAHDWPGNVRELKHAMEHALAFARDAVIEPRHLPSSLQASAPRSALALYLPEQGEISLPETLRDCEHRLIDWALARSGGNQAQAAELLSIPRTTFRSRLAALREDMAARRDDISPSDSEE